MRKNILFSDVESEQETVDEKQNDIGQNKGKIEMKTVEFKSEPRIIREGDNIEEALEQSKIEIIKQIESMRKQGWILCNLKSHTLNVEPITY